MRKTFTPEEERRRMQEGKLYLPTDPDLLAEQEICLEKLYDYNHTRPSQGAERQRLLQEMFAEIGEGVYLEPPLRANWAGRHVHLGKNIYANFNLTLVDDGEIYIGDYTMIGPNVTIATAGHPVLPELREEAYQFNIPVHIGRNVWIGAGVIILPGVTVGDNTVIGAGSVVTKDVSSDVVAVGNPCRVLRPIGEKDRNYYYKDQKIDL
ncbi:sugar O-acetyltransferase [uncultured Merdimonas sp.]|uniref:sugar O-acetyltransferase n=1 Tax=uncultured Merdimonas sp. TaxID=2023269 RepID=UPI00320A8311